MPLKTVFAGTPDFAVPSLASLLDSGHQVAAVYTQPDRPAGRGRRITQSAVKQFSVPRGLDVRQPESLESEHDFLRATDVDVLIVVAFGLILPRAVLEIPRHGCINVHASLLPRWRGAAPIARAIEAGDADTGITVMQMDEGLDTGDILLQLREPIGPTDTAGSLHDRLAPAGARALREVLAQLESGRLDARHQDHDRATYARKITKAQSRLDWHLSADELARKVRAFVPRPVATSCHHGTQLRIWGAVAVEDRNSASAKPGTILTSDPRGILVQTGAATLLLTRLQRVGGKVLSAANFLNGYPMGSGECLGM